MLTRTRIVAAAALALLARGALAQEYFDFGKIPGVPSEPNVQVDLNAALLAFVAEATKGGDVDLSEAVSQIEGIRVRVYEHLEDAAAVLAFIDDTTKTLERANWQRMVYVRDDADNVRIYVKLNGERITGMTVMVVDDSEAVFVNVAGSITPAQLGRVARSMGAGDALSGLDRDGDGWRNRDRRDHDQTQGDADAR
jgi:hypothetical protein